MYVGGFRKEHATISKTSCEHCGLQPFLKGKSYLEMRTLSPFLNWGFLTYRSGLLYRMDEKSEFFTLLGIKSIEYFLSEFSVVTN